MTTILVVEDEAIVADDLQRTLKLLGYDAPEPVDSADDAVARVAAAKPDLVLMDIRLHGKRDGIDAAREIRDRFAVPVVYLTSHSDEATLQRAKSAIPYGYLLKPFTDRDLRTTIEVALQRHAAERATSERAQWLDATVRSMGDAVLTTDREGCVTSVNPVAERLTGWTRDAALGRPATEVLRLVDTSGGTLVHPVHAVLSRGTPHDLPRDTYLVARTGAAIAIDDSSAPIVDAAGHVVGAVFLFRDKSERQRLERRVAQVERLAWLGVVAGGVGHELNNPLSWVSANVDLSLELIARLVTGATPKLTLDEATRELRQLLGEAKDGCERMRDVLVQLGSFARPSVRSVQAVDVQMAVETAVRSLPALVRANVEVRVAPMLRDVPRVLASEPHLAQVICTLLNEAAHSALASSRRKEPPSKSRARVPNRESARDAALPVLDVVIDADGEAALVDIVYAGDPSSDFFEPFGSRQSATGSGLALAVARRVVLDLGGSVDAERTPDGQARIRLSLPAATSAATLGAKRALEKRTKNRLLVVATDPELLRDVERQLDGDREITIETDPRIAVARVRNGEVFDVVLADAALSFGPERFLRALHEVDALLAARTVFLTGGPTETSVRSFLATTRNRVVEKPVDRTLLSEALRFART